MSLRRCALALSIALIAAPALAVETPYQQPSAAIQAVLDAKGQPAYSPSPDQRTLAIAAPREHRSIADLARPVLQLAGKRFDPAASGPQLITPINGLALRELANPAGTPRAVNLPAGGDFYLLRWAPDSKHFLLNRRTASATELWVGDATTGALKQLKGVRLNNVVDNDIAWVGADELVVMAVPDKRGAAPHNAVPTGPSVQESWGRKSPEVTYQDMLKNPQDEALFAYHATAVLRRVNLTTGASREISEPGLIVGVQAVGTKGLLKVERLLQPFSYAVGVDGFGQVVELRDANGKLVKELGRIKLKEGVPTEGVITGPRAFFASPFADASIYWVEALDGGDPKNKVPHRDHLMRLDAPYTGEAREVHKTAGRLSRLDFLEGGKRIIVTEVDRDRLWVAADLLTLDGSAAPKRLQDRSLRDRYRDPGTPLMRAQANGRLAARVDNDSLWLTGLGASRDGDRPFIDRLSLVDAKTTRLFQSSASHYERPLTVLDASGSRILTSRESFAEPPNLMLRSGADLAQMQALTNVADPTPQLRAIKRELVKFKRADGVELSFWLYLPPDYKTGEKRATLVWAYPLEFTDASTAGQVSGAMNKFNTFGGTSPLMMLLDGYVVLMDATMPVVGDPKTVNDTFVEQITANAKAIIDKADELGVSDRNKMVVGGHSYGAFMTANLLAHNNLFRSGIARSGAYNRSLTPFGFQSERRTYWDAQDVYLKLSPFNYADKLKAPILLIHGENDNNTGTFPMQSQRFFAALQGTGGKVRYVTLPFESHGYSARESLGHTLWEMSNWIKRTTAAE